jgi:hypothetical protein
MILFISYLEGFFNIPQNFIWGLRLYFLSEGRRAVDFYRPRPGLVPWTLGPMASTLNTRPLRTTIALLLIAYVVQIFPSAPCTQTSPQKQENLNSRFFYILYFMSPATVHPCSHVSVGTLNSCSN